MISHTTGGARRALVIALSSVAAAGACQSAEPEPPGPIDVATYARVMSELADLQRFPPPGPDHLTRVARADSARQAILDAHGVTADELLTYAEIVGARPDLMVEISERIVAITDSMARARTGAGAVSDTAGAVSDTEAARFDPADAATGAGRAARPTPDSVEGDTARRTLPDRLERLRRPRSLESPRPRDSARPRDSLRTPSP